MAGRYSKGVKARCTGIIVAACIFAGEVLKGRVAAGRTVVLGGRGRKNRDLNPNVCASQRIAVRVFHVGG